MDAKSGAKAAREGSWGVKLKIDVKRPIVGLATHVKDSTLAVLHADGVLRGYGVTAKELVPLYTVALDLALSRSTAQGLLSMVQHPFVPGGVLILQVRATPLHAQPAQGAPLGGRAWQRLGARARARAKA
jgi:hypothetical protein